jgi:hypothetical protein
MAMPSIKLVNALRKAAGNLREGMHYAWGHHGACNCGHLLQVVTKLNKEQILQYAHTGTGEWTELAEEYCNTSNTPLSLLMSQLESLGLTPTDIHNIEYLQDREVLKHLPGGFRWLQRNIRTDVIEYFETFSNLLEEKLKKAVDPPFIQRLQAREPEMA